MLVAVCAPFRRAEGLNDGGAPRPAPNGPSARLVALGFRGVFAIFPVLWALITSLKNERDIISRAVHLLPSPVTLQNYVAIWTQSNLPTLMRNSAVVTTLFTVLICVFGAGTLASYAVSRMRFAGRNADAAVLPDAADVPGGADGDPALHHHAQGSGCSTRASGLALAYTGFLLPIFIWMMKGFFDASADRSWRRPRASTAARGWARWCVVVLPLVRGGLFACAVFVAIARVERISVRADAHDIQLRLSRTWPVGLQLMVGEFQLPWGTLSAGGILSILPVLVLFAIVQRSMVRGLAAGAVKG